MQSYTKKKREIKFCSWKKIEFQPYKLKYRDKTAIMTEIEIYSIAQRATFGLIDHYFLMIPMYQLEFHLGIYSRGLILPAGRTVGAHLCGRKLVCDSCFVKLMHDLESGEYNRLIGYFPFVNCETLTTGISVQSIILINSIFVYASFAFGKFKMGFFISVVLLLCLLLFSKYNFSRTYKFKCPHM